MKKSFYILILLLFAGKLVHAQQSLLEQYQQKLSNLVSSKPTEEVAQATSVNQLMDFARSLIGVRYRYASGNPEKGFDCSGFVSYVFQNFGFKVPRSSVEFSTTGTPISLDNAKVGDVLIFTGSNPKVRKIGHVGIIYSKEGDEIKFIHSTSGKANGVTITAFDKYYKSRFIKVVSIL